MISLGKELDTFRTSYATIRLRLFLNLDSKDEKNSQIPAFSFVRSDIDLPHFHSCSAVQILLPDYGWPNIDAIA